MGEEIRDKAQRSPDHGMIEDATPVTGASRATAPPRPPRTPRRPTETPQLPPGAR